MSAEHDAARAGVRECAFCHCPRWIHGRSDFWCPEFTEGRVQRECMDCGEPATHVTADGVPLCEGDYQQLLRDSAEEDWV